MGYWGTQIGLDVLENAAKIANTDEDKAYNALSPRAGATRSAGTWSNARRVAAESEGRLGLGRKTD